jgi:opacity protein-like surface antigen
MRSYLTVAIGTLVLVLGFSLAAPMAAQDQRVPEAGQEERPTWRFTFTPHLWASGLSGRVGVGPAVGEVDLSFSDIMDDFDIGVMGLFEARRYPWVIRADLFYVSLSDEQARTVGTGETLQIGQDEFMLQPELGYTILRRPWGGIDALIGVRYWDLTVDLSIQPQEVSGSQTWVDGTVGAALKYQPAERWHLFSKVDAGAGGSDFTWQGYGGAGYDLGRCCTLIAAYRYLDVDYEKDGGLIYDVQMHGPAIGVTLRF